MSDTSMTPKAARDAIRMADVLGAFSLAGDLAVGLQAEHGARSCYIGMQIAEALGLSDEERIHLYYSELLKDAGCTAYTSQLAASWLADELAAKRELQFFRDPNNPFDVIPWILKYVAAGASLPTRASRSIDFLAHGREFLREGFESTCAVATRIAQRLGMPTAVQDALMQVFEQWDGKGMPAGSSGENIPVISRIVLVTSNLEVMHRTGGREAACSVARERKGKAFDPAVADAFLTISEREEFWTPLEKERIWDTVLSLEPAQSPHRQVDEQQLEDVVLAFADYSDLKSPYIAGHSRRVAALAEAMARRMAFRPEEVVDIRRAALAHDIGLVAIPSFVLDRSEDRLTEAEREQMRLHPYHSRQILSRVSSLAGAAAIVASHHELGDGTGYPAGLAGIQISPQASVLAVADCFDELTHDGPDRMALAPEAALELMRAQPVRFSIASVEALAAEEGLSRTSEGQRRPWPQGLTDREVEVLRLVARGNDRRQVAKLLVLSEGTVRSHLEHIYGKIGVSNRAAATLFAVENGLLS
jgi:HD-GYP domain-containing protein (c-di-GMP phosphodiesterase class II)/DNA-binding CsgD family transcriptional regulator